MFRSAAGGWQRVVGSGWLAAGGWQRVVGIRKVRENLNLFTHSCHIFPLSPAVSFILALLYTSTSFCADSPLTLMFCD